MNKKIMLIWAVLVALHLAVAFVLPHIRDNWVVGWMVVYVTITGLSELGLPVLVTRAPGWGWAEPQRFWVDAGDSRLGSVLLNPGYSNPDFFQEYGMTCLNLKKNQEAIGHMNRSRAIDPSASGFRILSNLAWACMCNQEYDKALPILDEAIEKSDLKVTALLNRAYIFNQKGETQKAQEDIRQATHLLPFDRRCLSNVMGQFA